MLHDIKRYASSIKQISQHDDDTIDRLNYKFTSMILVGFALLVFATNYVGQPIQCWVPRQFTDVWEAYTESYCFIENTYFVPMNESNLPAAHTREDREMVYYQWVPFILLLMALFFCLPRAIWAIFPSYSGLTVADMVTSAREASEKFEDFETCAETFANNFERRNRLNVDARQSGSSIFNWYMVMKAAILANVAIQFFALNAFLGTEYTLWGFGVLVDMLNNRHWQESGHFPRVAFCDITSRELGNIHNWTVQCVLMVNMFNEKIFIFVWFWLAAVLGLTAVNFVVWLRNRVSVSNRKRFIAELLKQDGIVRDELREKRLYEEVLKDDGMLFLRLLDANSGRLRSEEVIRKIYNVTFKVQMKINTPLYSGDLVPTYDTDWIDRLRYFRTVMFLVVAAAFIMTKQYVGESVQCWIPEHLAGGWEAYSEKYCLIENTYFVPMNDTNLPAKSERENRELRYYQWVPFILLGLALALYIPRLAWNLMESHAGIDVSKMTALLRRSATATLDAPTIAADDDGVANLSVVEKAIHFPLTTCLLTTKILATCVIFASLVFMDYFMGIGTFYGMTTAVDILSGRQWQESGTFPRVTFCDVEVRELGNIHNWTFQCVLMVNMFNEKLFVALWLWFALLAILSIIDIFAFVNRFSTGHQIQFLRQILSCTSDDVEPDDSDIEAFIKNVLTIDGVNFLHLALSNATIFEVSLIVKPLWTKYFNQHSSHR
ncbi:unnamed protein product [Caenorhabditis bovis]|uniref:Innexin n=1 Tax=Caenorhabditis bovis TaxID=2654633 RepID=A0A8S1F0X9_9PELO|nr:unnamed protein product [Caenorhabditis bovis]